MTFQCAIGISSLASPLSSRVTAVTVCHSPLPYLPPMTLVTAVTVEPGTAEIRHFLVENTGDSDSGMPVLRVGTADDGTRLTIPRRLPAALRAATTVTGFMGEPMTKSPNEAPNSRQHTASAAAAGPAAEVAKIGDLTITELGKARP